MARGDAHAGAKYLRVPADRRLGCWRGTAIYLFLLALVPSCGGGPDYDRDVWIVGDAAPFGVSGAMPWASPGSDVELTLTNAASDPNVVHDLVLLDPDDGHVIAAIEPVAAGRAKHVRFQAPKPGVRAQRDYPFRCSQPGHGEGGVLQVVAPSTGHTNPPPTL